MRLGATAENPLQAAPHLPPYPLLGKFVLQVLKELPLHVQPAVSPPWEMQEPRIEAGSTTLAKPVENGSPPAVLRRQHPAYRPPFPLPNGAERQGPDCLEAVQTHPLPGLEAPERIHVRDRPVAHGRPWRPSSPSCCGLSHTLQSAKSQPALPALSRSIPTSYVPYSSQEFLADRPGSPCSLRSNAAPRRSVSASPLLRRRASSARSRSSARSIS